MNFLFLLLSVGDRSHYSGYSHTLFISNIKIIIRIKNIGLTTIGISSHSQLTYRKGSIDDYESELPISSLQKKNEALTKTIQYIGFCGLLVLFQYLFFNYIVFLYNPLSIDEAKYIIYIQAFHQLDKAD